MEKHLLMQAVMLAMTLQTVKMLALEDADSIDVVSNYLKCFPCLEKLYISVSSSQLQFLFHHSLMYMFHACC
jgi:hypothetical protein